MDPSRLAVLRHQAHVAWTLCEYHLDGLGDAECRWEPAEGAWTVRATRSGVWHADWVEPEPDPVPATTIGWLTWHLGFWMSMVYDHAFAERRLTRQDITWPGSADATVEWIRGCHRRWTGAVESLVDADLDDPARADWPYRDGRPFGYFLAWYSVELTKNAAEIGQLRTLYRVAGPSAGGR